MKSTFLAFTVLILINLSSYAQINSGSLFIDPEIGQDTNLGTKDSPLQSLFEAGRRVNKANGKGSITIYLFPGIYGLDATVTFHPVNWHFTKEERLTIRSTVLPDDPDWNPGKMPVIVSTMPLNFKPYGNPDPIGGASYGIQIETSHVTIQGLRILGTPVHETPEEGLVRRNYPIVREGEDLEDLRITQCLFIGDRHAIPNHVGILASGQGIVVDHCIFYKVKDAVVFWQSKEPAKGCEMHHNLIVGNYGAAVWSWTLAEDFKYYNNVVTDANIFWILDKEEKNTFNISNSMVIGYDELVNKGGGASGFGEKGNQNKLKFSKDVVIKKDGNIQIVEDLTSKYYLHIKPGTEGSNLKAGLFTK